MIDPTLCPYCSSPLSLPITPKELIHHLEKLALPQLTKVLRALARRPGEYVHHEELINALWPDPDKEPSQPDKQIAVLIYRMKPILRALGWQIKAKNRAGGGRMLAPIIDHHPQQMV